MTTPKFHFGPPVVRVWIRLASKGFFWVVVYLYHVGAHFEAFNERVLTAPSVSSCIFFYHSNLAIGIMYVLKHDNMVVKHDIPKLRPLYVFKNEKKYDFKQRIVKQKTKTMKGPWRR